MLDAYLYAKPLWKLENKKEFDLHYYSKFTQNKEDDSKMENLYQVYIVKKDRTVTVLGPVVAKNEEEAKHESGAYSDKYITGRLSDVTIIVKNLGSVVVEG